MKGNTSHDSWSNKRGNLLRVLSVQSDSADDFGAERESEVYFCGSTECITYPPCEEIVGRTPFLRYSEFAGLERVIASISSFLTARAVSSFVVGGCNNEP